MKKPSVYFATTKCANTSLRAVLKEIGSCNALLPSSQHTYRVFFPAHGSSETPRTAFDNLHKHINDNLFIVVPYWKYPIHLSLAQTMPGSEDCVSPEELMRLGRERLAAASDLTNDDKRAVDLISTAGYHSNAHTWTVVRNPWHRIAAAYFECIKMRDPDDPIYDISARMTDLSFEQFVRWVTSPWGVHTQHHCDHDHRQRTLTLNHLGRGVSESELLLLLQLSGLRTHSGVQYNHLFELYGYAHTMHVCNKRVLQHTQRWEDSLLFTGYTVWGVGEGFAADRFIGSMRGQPIELDHVLRFENLQGDFDKMMDELDMPNVSLPHKNSEKTLSNKKYSEMYTPELSDLVRKHYAYEIEAFGYESEKDGT